MRRFYLDRDRNTILATDYDSIGRHFTEAGHKLIDTPRAARQYALRHGSEILLVNADDEMSKP
jgi:hypothetical protein